MNIFNCVIITFEIVTYRAHRFNILHDDDDDDDDDGVETLSIYMKMEVCFNCKTKTRFDSLSALCNDKQPKLSRVL